MELYLINLFCTGKRWDTVEILPGNQVPSEEVLLATLVEKNKNKTGVMVV